MRNHCHAGSNSAKPVGHRLSTFSINGSTAKELRIIEGMNVVSNVMDNAVHKKSADMTFRYIDAFQHKRAVV